MTDARNNKQDWEKQVALRLKQLIENMGMQPKDFAEAFWLLLGWSNFKAAEMALYKREKVDLYYAIRFAMEFGLNVEYVLCLRDDIENCVIAHGRYADKAALVKKLNTAPGKKQSQ